MTTRQRLVRQAEAGYTLTELLVVLLILGLITAAITPQVIGRLDSSKVKAAKLQADMLAASADLFYLDLGRYPTSEEGLQALLVKPDDLDGWQGPYVRGPENLIDPWRNKFVYEPPIDGAPARVTSFGADGARGGEGQAKDLTFPNVSE